VKILPQNSATKFLPQNFSAAGRILGGGPPPPPQICRTELKKRLK